MMDDGWMVDGWMDGWMDDGWMVDGWMDGGWMDGWMVDGWMDGDGRRRGELARQMGGFVVQVLSAPGALVCGEEKLEGPAPSA